MEISHIEHIGIAVPDLAEAIKYYENALGLKCYKQEVVEDQKVTTAFFKVGDTKIELLEPTCPESTIAKFIEKNGGRGGMHHLAFAIKDGVAKFGGKVPPKGALKLPLRDGDAERDDEAYKGAWFVNANSTTAPQIVDRAVQPILDRAEVYSGCHARVSINFYAFNTNGNKGIACGLGNIQKVRDGEPLSGRTSAADDFATDLDDDFLS